MCANDKCANSMCAKEHRPRAAVAQWTKRLTRNGYSPIRGFETGKAQIFFYYTISR